MKLYSDETETVDMLTVRDAEYTVPILIGDPPQGNMQAAFVPFTMGTYMSVTAAGCENCTT